VKGGVFSGERETEEGKEITAYQDHRWQKNNRAGMGKVKYSLKKGTSIK
jgi:hypothetical protein